VASAFVLARLTTFAGRSELAARARWSGSRDLRRRSSRPTSPPSQGWPGGLGRRFYGWPSSSGRRTMLACRACRRVPSTKARVCDGPWRPDRCT